MNENQYSEVDIIPEYLSTWYKKNKEKSDEKI